MTTTPKPMTPKQAADILAAHNRWRRNGDFLQPMEDPGILGLAIDCAVKFMRKHPRKRTPVCPKCGSIKRYCDRVVGVSTCKEWYECRDCKTRYGKDGKVMKP